ncbi:TetR family transcriptional regulator [Lachnospiraceae bacterium]|nr:TetR family transcriptional regulator [Lachnospiraceae bacterium]
MKHEEISLNTKKELVESLKKAMKNKPFQKITVSELIRDCNMNRNTFYYHFEDIYSLLKWMFEQEAIEIVKHFDFLVDYEEAIVFVMDYIEANDYIINCAYDSIGQDELKRFFYADFLEIVVSLIEHAEKITGKTISAGYKEFLSHFYMEAMAGMLIEWIKDRKGRERDTVIQYISSTVQESLLGILNSNIKI